VDTSSIQPSSDDDDGNFSGGESELETGDDISGEEVTNEEVCHQSYTICSVDVAFSACRLSPFKDNSFHKLRWKGKAKMQTGAFPTSILHLQCYC
jgi:hypothetical protein